ncbi:hypothetical protein FRAAL3766 [Frankia alni ACN14a]|uniref:Uncharacterized protein n=1 Tax=Frankia alni (strain DSM 45986 / CECT 9034 / ACN14a) TaxID=326424 RepID=Q0RJA3_FRAAA|nr:hypothetical protein FRAAL3766 [Frankia alni ACN14a]
MYTYQRTVTGPRAEPDAPHPTNATTAHTATTSPTRPRTTQRRTARHPPRLATLGTGPTSLPAFWRTCGSPHPAPRRGDHHSSRHTRPPTAQLPCPISRTVKPL